MVRYSFENLCINKPGSEIIIHYLSVLHDYFVEKGFRFLFASLRGHGDGDAYHTGEGVYGAEYTDYDLFINNYETDFLSKSEEVYEESGGWISSLNYDEIRMILSNDTVEIKFMFGGIDGEPRLLILFNELSESNDDIKTLVKEKIFEMFGDKIAFSEDICHFFPDIWKY